MSLRFELRPSNPKVCALCEYTNQVRAYGEGEITAGVIQMGRQV